MNPFVIFGIIVVLILLGTRKLPMLLWFAIWLIAVYSMLRLGISPPIPSSVLKLYMCLTMVGLLAYVCADNQRFDSVRGQLIRFITEPKFTVPLYAVIILLPALLAAKIYRDMNIEVMAPTFARTIHPAPPNEITFKGQKVNLITGKNPFRELEQSDSKLFHEHVEQGRAVYYSNCVFCHGDDMNGDGMFAHGFNPIPANFNSPTTIAMLQESYLFWRISKGGPGLPDESGPWSSSMPSWEKFLNEEQIWNVILFLYDYTGRKPRAEEGGGHE